MTESFWGIKCRIFKKERIREEKDNLIIVLSKREDINRNQIELTWKNQQLDSSHLMIVGKVFTKEWERIFKQYSVSKSFIQERENQQVRLYLSFPVTKPLNSKDIKELLTKTTGILEVCLQRVADKLGLVIERQDVVNSLLEPESDHLINHEESEEDRIIRQLHSDIEEQERLLYQLATEQQKKSIQDDSRLAEEVKIEQLTQQGLKTSQQEKQYLLAELIRKDTLIDSLQADLSSLTKEVSELVEELATNNRVNRELDKANIMLNNRVKEQKIDVTRLEKVTVLEKKVRELNQENSEYRIKINETQSMNEKYRNQVTQLNQSLENVKQAQEELVEKVQIDYDTLDDHLREAEKKIILEVNERQKAEIQLEELRTKLARAHRENEELERQDRKQSLEISNQIELYEKSKAKEAKLQETLDESAEELKLSLATNDVLKSEIYALEVQKEKWDQLDEWQINYQDLVDNYSQLEEESLSYRQEITFLTKQLENVVTKYEQAETEIIRLSTKAVEAEEDQPLEENKALIKWDKVMDSEYEEELDFNYEADPFVEEVIAEELINVHKKDQLEDEQAIKRLLESYYDENFHDIKILKTDYRKAVLGFKFLGFRWSQVLMMDDSDKQTEFLEWCTPFINKMSSFEEELSFDVKKSIFSKNYVTIDESTYNILKGYSELSTYLDTYYLKVSYYIDKYFLNEGNR